MSDGIANYANPDTRDMVKSAAKEALSSIKEAAYEEAVSVLKEYQKVEDRKINDVKKELKVNLIKHIRKFKMRLYGEYSEKYYNAISYKDVRDAIDYVFKNTSATHPTQK
jgi:hypothetical protein